MAEPTEEQIELAAQAASKAKIPGLEWNGSTGDRGMELWRATMRAAAPFLQMPWDSPTTDEVRVASIQIRETGLVSKVLGNFISNRNLALLPQPVDPRREKIREALMQPHVLNQELMLDAIIAALDEVKK